MGASTATIPKTKMPDTTLFPIMQNLEWQNMRKQVQFWKKLN